jgi:hypothetical protein
VLYKASDLQTTSCGNSGSLNIIHARFEIILRPCAVLPPSPYQLKTEPCWRCTCCLRLAAVPAPARRCSARPPHIADHRCLALRFLATEPAYTGENSLRPAHFSFPAEPQRNAARVSGVLSSLISNRFYFEKVPVPARRLAVSRSSPIQQRSTRLALLSSDFVFHRPSITAS